MWEGRDDLVSEYGRRAKGGCRQEAEQNDVRSQGLRAAKSHVLKVPWRRRMRLVSAQLQVQGGGTKGDSAVSISAEWASTLPPAAQFPSRSEMRRKPERGGLAQSSKPKVSGQRPCRGPSLKSTRNGGSHAS